MATVAPAKLASSRIANCACASALGGLAATSLQPLSIDARGKQNETRGQRPDRVLDG